MKKYDESYERRAKPRILVSEGAMAFVERKYGKIIDVSMKGLSFQYIEIEKEPLLAQFSRNKCFSLDITFGAHNFCLTDVPIKIVLEQERKINSNYGSEISLIRCSVQFRDLTPNQLFLLKRFVLINQYGAKH